MIKISLSLTVKVISPLCGKTVGAKSKKRVESADANFQQGYVSEKEIKTAS
jgi:hypothetical protein